MKPAKCVSFLLAFLLPASPALAQIGELRTSTQSAEGNEISAARSRYRQNANISQENSNDAKDLAQLGEGGMGMPLHHHSEYRREESYPSRRMDRGSGGHVLVGAAIGFTLGALLGAKANKNPQPGTTAGEVVIVGGCGALIGGFIGASHSFFHHSRIYSPVPPGDEQADRNTDSKGSHVEGSSAERSVSPRSTSTRRALGIQYPVSLKLTPGAP